MLQYFVSLETGGKMDYQTAFRKLKKLFSPFVLRRRKDDVLSQIMPPKEKKMFRLLLPRGLPLDLILSAMYSIGKAGYPKFVNSPGI